VKILLDENFPLALARTLRAKGKEVEHVGEINRGCSDQIIIHRLRRESILFLTQNGDFAEVRDAGQSFIIWSRISQSRPLQERVEMWSQAIDEFFMSHPSEHWFELLDDGRLLPYSEVGKQDL